MMKRRAAVVRGILLLLLVVGATLMVEARFRQPNSEYQARRAKLRGMLDGPVVLFGYTSKHYGGEVSVFFQDENFYYLTGYNEPDAALLLIPERPNGKAYGFLNEILRLPPRDARRAKWEGPKVGPEDANASEKTGFETVRPFAALREDLVAVAKVFPAVYTALPGREENGYPHVATWSAWVRNAVPNNEVTT